MQLRASVAWLYFCVLLLGCQGDGSRKIGATPSLLSPGRETLSCRYTNPFSRQRECRGYEGSAWTRARAARDCQKPFTGARGSLGEEPCDRQKLLGACLEHGQDAERRVTYAYGGDSTIYEAACESFAGGVWLKASGIAKGAAEPVLDPALHPLLKGDVHVQVQPSGCVDGACLKGLIARRAALVFSPRDGAPSEGLIVYPGAKIDVRSYAEVAYALAREGVLVALVPMPDGVAFKGIDRAQHVLAAYPELKRVHLAGHSLGGAMAARFLARRIHEARSELGLILWAAYPDSADSLAESSVRVTSLYGSEDGITTPDEVERSRGQLPHHAQLVRIDGGNHAQFARTQALTGDHVARIDLPRQLDLVSMLTLRAIRFDPREAPAPHPGFAVAEQLESSFCGEAQRRLLGVNEATLPGAMLKSEESADLKAFGVAKPSLSSTPPLHVITHLYRVQTGNAETREGPASYHGELWCKLKSRAALRAALRLSDAGSGSCSDVQRLSLEQALALFPASERDEKRARVQVLTERTFASGVEWLTSPKLEVDVDRTRKAVTIRPSGVEVSVDDVRVTAEARGVHYCKVVSPVALFSRLLSME